MIATFSTYSYGWMDGWMDDPHFGCKKIMVLQNTHHQPATTPHHTPCTKLIIPKPFKKKKIKTLTYYYLGQIQH
jgi:hypothetical protein